MKFPFPWRRLAALALVLAMAPPAAFAQLPRQNPATCKGQPELRPLQPLEILVAGKRTKFMVEIADDDTEREYGLMCRRGLAKDRGMLFDFKRMIPETAFWMRNTLIPLDIIYIRQDGTVVSIARNARPLDETPLFSGGAIRAVLELPAGRSAELGLLPGDRILHRIFPSG